MTRGMRKDLRSRGFGFILSEIAAKAAFLGMCKSNEAVLATVASIKNFSKIAYEVATNEKEKAIALQLMEVDYV